MLPKPKAIVFDLDGTLVDTVGTRLEAWLRAFAEFGIPASRPQVSGLIGSDGPRLARIVAEAAHASIDARDASAIDHRAGEIYDELNRDPAPLPGVKDLIEALDRRRLPWAIATSSQRAQVGVSVKALQLAQPPTIVDGSHVQNAKPAPDLLLLAAKQLRVVPESAWYVGDSVWDMQAAVAAGMPAIGVTTGSADCDELAQAGGRLILGSLGELIALLG